MLPEIFFLSLCFTISAHRFRRPQPHDVQEYKYRQPDVNQRAGLMRRKPAAISSSAAAEIQNTEVSTASQDSTTLPLETSGISNYIYQYSVVEVPLITICPQSLQQPSSSSNPSPLSTISKSAFYNLTSNTTISSLTPLNATNQTDTTQPIIARVIQGSDTCQTIYTPKTTTLCSTTLTLAGLPAVQITDCDQWVTFSSAAPLCDLSVTAATQWSMAVDSPLTGLGLIEGFTSPARKVIDSGQPPQSQSQSPESDTVTGYEVVYVNFVAHWFDLARNEVPSIVRVESCALGRIGDACDAWTESWGVVRSTSLMVTTGLVDFRGPALVMSLGRTITSTISVYSTVFSTVRVVVPSLRRRVVVVVSDDAVSNAVGSTAMASTSNSVVAPIVVAPPAVVISEVDLERVAEGVNKNGSGGRTKDGSESQSLSTGVSVTESVNESESEIEVTITITNPPVTRTWILESVSPNTSSIAGAGNGASTSPSLSMSISANTNINVATSTSTSSNASANPSTNVVANLNANDKPSTTTITTTVTVTDTVIAKTSTII